MAGTVAPLVSVITPFFNAGGFIREAVESVLSQTFDDWELLLVDDGSTDGSTEIARDYAAAHGRRIRYVGHDGHRNRGATVSRNLGIHRSQGVYLAFLDADDVWLPRKLQEQTALLDSCPDAAMVFGRPLYWRRWHEEANRDDVRPELWTEPNRLVRPPDMLLASYPLGPGGAPCPSDLLVRREFVERVGGFEESFTGIYQLFEDQAFLAKVYLIGSVFVADACWTMYRLHENSCVAAVKRAGRYHHVRHHYLRWLERYLVSTNNMDSRIHRSLADALKRYDRGAAEWARRQWRRLMNRLVPRAAMRSRAVR